MKYKIEKILQFQYAYKLNSDNIFISEKSGYWSNLSKAQSKIFNSDILLYGPRKAVNKLNADLEKMIYSEVREAALELLNVRAGSVCIDYGCMWGVLSVGMAKRGCSVLAVDQTYDSLSFLKYRAIEDNISNIYCIQDDIKNLPIKNIANYALVNGVLEWIPVTDEIEVSKLYSHKNTKMDKQSYKKNDPRKMQLDFLCSIRRALTKDGKLLLAIENRHSYQYYLGMRDPHANLLFTTFLPRFLSNIISYLCKGTEYRSYIYSFNELQNLIKQAGFRNIKLYSSFPNYHFPKLILPYSSSGISFYKPYSNSFRITKKQKIAYYFEIFIMKFLKLKFLSPAIIVIADK